MPGNLWLGELLYENAVLMNRLDTERLGLKDGDQVRLGSPTNPDGSFELGNGEVQRSEGKVKILEGIRPGVVAISWHFGHWAYGSRDVVVDGWRSGLRSTLSLDARFLEWFACLEQRTRR
ncbi:hypothetical protein MYX82_03560 [Acidobacteria bacterium AH-259-D05]|nr:hypothetical protein [Acidobacteria bacterium AH-259-D05]